MSFDNRPKLHTVAFILITAVFIGLVTASGVQALVAAIRACRVFQ